MKRDCKQCKLSTKCAVFGSTKTDLNKIKLIVIGSYPDENDEAVNVAFSPIHRSTKSQNKTSNGLFIRKVLERLLGSEYKNAIYFTYAIKCNKRDNSITNKERIICKNKWLIDELNKFNSNIPILIMGNEGIKALFSINKNINDYRGKISRWQNHPVVTTFDRQLAEQAMLNVFINNPDNVLQDLVELYKSKKVTHKLLNKFTQTKVWQPILPGTLAWFLTKDLKLLKKIVSSL